MLYRPVHFIGRYLWRLTVMVWLLTCTINAQVANPTPTPTPNPTPNAGESATGAFLESLDELSDGTHLIFKDRATGRVQLFPVVNAEALNMFRERWELQNQSRLYDLQNLTIEGTIRGDDVELQIEAQIRIRVPNEWVRVPLEFADFELIDPAPEHSVELPQTGTERFEKGNLPLKTWQLKGEGIHRLKFHLIGEISTDANGRKSLRVTAPVANQSRLLLKLPGIVPTAELLSTDKPTDKPLHKPMDVRTDDVLGISEIETWGLSKNTDITWAPEARSNDQPISLQATTPAKMKLDLTTEPASLTVEQAVSISGGSIDSVTVQLPPGIANVEITARDANDSPVVRGREVSDDATAKIEFVAPMTGTVVLNYGLELTKNAKDVLIRIPVIEGAANQTADLDLVVPIGLEVEFAIPDDGSVRQKRVEANAEPRVEGVRQVAYRLFSEVAELRLSIKDPEAFYSVVPLVNFETDGNLVMTARFTVNVVRGSFNEMTIVWPGYEADGWKILDGYTRLMTDPPTNLAPVSDGDSVTLQFPTRQSREFVIEIQALRDLASFQDGDGLLRLPDILTPRPHKTNVSLIESDTYSMMLSARDGKTTFPQLPLSRWPAILTQREEPLTVWLVDSPNQAVHLDVQKQRSEIRASVLAEVSVVNDGIHCSETLSYRVRNLDVREVRLLVNDVSPTVRLRDFEEPLQPLSTLDNVATYSLPEAMRGEFDLLVDYWSAESTSKSRAGQQVEFPLVLPASMDETIESIQVATRMPESITLIQSADWTRVHSDSFPAMWRTATIPEVVPLQLQHSLRSDATGKPHLLVVKSALVGNNLMTATTAVYSKAPGIVVFSVPSGAVVYRARLQGDDAESEIVANDSTGQLVQIRPRQNAAGQSATATLVVQQGVRSSRLLGPLHPLLPKPVAAGPDCNCVWVLRQAADVSLFHWDGSVSELAPSTSLISETGQLQDQVTALVDILAPVGDSSRADVMRLLGDSLMDSDQYQLLVGPALSQPQTLMVISRKATLLATAIIGLLMYFAMTRLHSLALTTVAVLLAAVVTTIFAFVPGPAHMILIRFVPGCVIAVIAGALQRWFARRPVFPRKNVNTSDGSTIFTIDHPQTPTVHNPV
jgi:hypothetical protein